MIRSSFMNLGALIALQSLSPAASYDAGSILLPADLAASGPGPIHRRGRFKQNQRRQRKGGK